MSSLELISSLLVLERSQEEDELNWESLASVELSCGKSAICGASLSDLVGNISAGSDTTGTAPGSMMHGVAGSIPAHTLEKQTFFTLFSGDCMS